MSTNTAKIVGTLPNGKEGEIAVSASGAISTATVGTTNVISTLNSRAAAALGNGAVFQGVGEDVSEYGRVGVAIVSDNATDGVLTIEVSQDGVTWGGPDRTWSDTRFAQPHMWNIVEQYFRIKYTNGATPAVNLAIQVQYSNNANVLLGHQLDETLLDETEATIARSVLVAKDETGDYANMGAVTKDGRTSIFTVSGYSNTFSVHLDVILTPNGTDVAYMLVDLSNTAVWPHTLTGEVVLEYLILEIDPATNFAGDFRIGYLKNVDATDGDFDTIIDIDMASKSDVFQEVIDFGSHGLHCSDTSHFGPVLANRTEFQTDVNLGGPDDPGTLTYPSGDGDLVLLVSGSNHAVGVSITLGYETVA